MVAEGAELTGDAGRNAAVPFLEGGDEIATRHSDLIGHGPVGEPRNGARVTAFDLGGRIGERLRQHVRDVGHAESIAGRCAQAGLSQAGEAISHPIHQAPQVVDVVHDRRP